MTDDPDAGETDPTGDPDADTAIRRLDQATIERIAAGEVVERPASVVKELVENSVDAGAGRIDVTVEGAGTNRIRVRDDGQGMTEADVRAAVREHTTSKIDDIDDLEAGVRTLGFRGEALHTIGAVARVTIRTKPQGADGAGTELRYEGGEVVSVDPVGCPEGTTVEVEDLFYNTPARRKYLKTEATEFAHVNRIVSRYALANPDVAVSLTHDDRETFATTGQGDLRAAIMSVYGREVAEGMIPVVAGAANEDATVTPGSLGVGADAADLPDGPLDGIVGLVSHPETTRSSREYVSSYVNGRWVDASVVREAVVEAYGGQLAADRYPFVVLFLDLDPGSVDVNVHPRKMEIRFDDENGVREQVRTATRQALLSHGLVRTSAPRGRSAPDEASVRPERSTASDQSSTASGSEGQDEAGGAGEESGATRGSAADDYAGTTRSPVDESSITPPPRRDRSDEGSTSDRSTADSTDRSTDDETTRSQGDREKRPIDESGSGSIDDEALPRDADTSPEDDRPPVRSTGSADSVESSGGSTESDAGSTESSAGSDAGAAAGSDLENGTLGDAPSGSTTGSGDSRGGESDRWFQGGTQQRTLDGEAATPSAEYDRLPRMRVLGQFDQTYVVAETDEGLVLDDHHAADERVNYERLRAAFEDGTTAQSLARPVDLEVTAGEAATFEVARDALEQLGFTADLVTESDAGNEGDGDGEDEDEAYTGGERRLLRVTAVPAVFDRTIDPEGLRDALATIVAGDHAADTVDHLADEFISDLACYPSITGNTSLTEGSVVDLLAALDDCENPYACPHGRPVIVEIDREEIEDRFERDYPGHGHRRDT